REGPGIVRSNSPLGAYRAETEALLRTPPCGVESSSSDRRSRCRTPGRSGHGGGEKLKARRAFVAYGGGSGPCDRWSWTPWALLSGPILNARTPVQGRERS